MFFGFTFALTVQQKYGKLEKSKYTIYLLKTVLKKKKNGKLEKK